MPEGVAGRWQVTQVPLEAGCAARHIERKRLCFHEPLQVDMSRYSCDLFAADWRSNNWCEQPSSAADPILQTAPTLKSTSYAALYIWESISWLQPQEKGPSCQPQHEGTARPAGGTSATHPTVSCSKSSGLATPRRSPTCLSNSEWLSGKPWSSKTGLSFAAPSTRTLCSKPFRMKGCMMNETSDRRAKVEKRGLGSAYCVAELEPSRAAP